MCILRAEERKGLGFGRGSVGHEYLPAFVLWLPYSHCTIILHFSLFETPRNRDHVNVGPNIFKSSGLSLVHLHVGCI